MVFNPEDVLGFQKADALSGCSTRWRQYVCQVQQLGMNIVNSIS